MNTTQTSSIRFFKLKNDWKSIQKRFNNSILNAPKQAEKYGANSL
jgi:hypothetical protein